jgi:hypothetical protein
LLEEGKARRLKWAGHASMMRRDKECIQNFRIHWDIYAWKVENINGNITLKWMLGTLIMRIGSEWK